MKRLLNKFIELIIGSLDCTQKLIFDFRELHINELDHGKSDRSIV